MDNATTSFCRVAMQPFERALQGMDCSTFEVRTGDRPCFENFEQCLLMLLLLNNIGRFLLLRIITEILFIILAQSSSTVQSGQ